MTTITSLAKIGRAAAADLQPAIQGQVSQGQVFQGQVFQGQVFQGQVFPPSHEGHSELKLGSNGAEDHLPEDHLPTVIARCETRQDVQLAVRTARAHGLAISVSSGESGPIGRVLKRGGMVIDLSAMRHNLLEVEIVLKNGQAVANVGRNADLFWALRGGARDFGVTTSLRIRLHALPSLLSGMIFYAWSDADLVFRGYSEIASSASEPHDLRRDCVENGR